MFISWAGPFYHFEGVLFEVHRYAGPILLNDNGEPSKRVMGPSFFKMWERFNKLSEEEKKKYLAVYDQKAGKYVPSSRLKGGSK